MARDISVVVPVFNTPNLVQSFWDQFMYKGELEFVFVDNGSDKPTADALRALRQANLGASIQIIRNAFNLGFGPANNLGAAAATGRILVFTQLDVAVKGDLRLACKYVKEGTLYGARLLANDTGWNNFNGRIVPYLEGYFLACTRTTWDLIGGFDPQYFPADFEDVDLSFAATQKGVPLSMLIGAKTEHNHPGQAGWSQYKDEKREAVTLRNRSLFRKKWSL